MQSLGMQILNPQSCRKSWGVSYIKLCFTEERPLLAQGSFSSHAVFRRDFSRNLWVCRPCLHQMCAVIDVEIINDYFSVHSSEALCTVRSLSVVSDSLRPHGL